MSDLIPLSLLPIGSLASVSKVIGKPEHVHRLNELGLRDGAEIEIVQGGAPCIMQDR